MPFPTASILDSANRADEGPPPSTDWTTLDGSPEVVSNQFANTDGLNPGSAYWDVETFGPDSEVYATFPTRQTDTGINGVFARYNGVDNAYLLQTYRIDATGDQLVFSTTATPNIWTQEIDLQDGDSIGLRLLGDQVEIYYKISGGSWTLQDIVTDTEISGAGYVGFSLNDTTARMDDFGGGDVINPTATIVVTDTLSLSDTETYPLFPIADTLTLTDSVVSVVGDTLGLADTVEVTAATIVIEDTLNLSDGEVIEISGPEPTPPGEAATGGLDNNTVLRLLYGNDKRNPVRSLDLGQAAPGAIRLLEGGFSPGAGELLELWSGQSIRQEGQQKLAESRDNSRLLISYVLKTAGSQAALSYFQRQINRFFTEAKLNQTQNQNHSVWLEYRWPDDLGTLPTPTFGQLSYYYEIYSAKVPKWPDNLHEAMTLGSGLIEGVGVELIASPAPEGLKQQAAKAGGSVTLVAKGVRLANDAGTKLWYTEGGTGLATTFTVTGWITAYWSSPADDRIIFDYYVNGSNNLQLKYDGANTLWTITKTVGGTPFTDNSAADTVATGDDVHFAIVQDATTLHLYVNGVSVASVTATATMTAGGTIALGSAASGTPTGADVAVDGWRILPADLSATQVLTLYNAELPIKTDGGTVGTPPYLWTKDGDNILDNADDTNRDDWGIIGGVSGDVEADLDIQITHSASRSTVWLGVKALDSTAAIADYCYFDSTESVSNAAYSGGAYYEASGTEVTDTSANRTITPALLFGRYRVLAHLKVPNNTAVTITPQYKLGTYYYSGKVTAYTGTGAFALVDLGDLIINTPLSVFTEATATLAYQVTIACAESITADFDFFLLLPYPYAKIKSIGSTTQYVRVEKGFAEPYNPTGNSRQGYSEYVGATLRAVPHKYNYLFFLNHDSVNVWTVSHTATLGLYVTPRFSLPGGMVA